jgi:hypothetical protein
VLFNQYNRYNGSLFELYCDRDNRLVAFSPQLRVIESPTRMNHGGLWFWIYVFYLSKYYEFVDTLFLVAKKVSAVAGCASNARAIKQKDLEFLHVFHHFTTVIVMLLGLVDHATYTW